MKMRWFLLVCGVSVAVALFGGSASSQTVVTFDDLSGPRLIFGIPQGYQGLNWTNFDCINAVLDASINGLAGDYYGMMTPSNVAFNADGLPSEIDSAGTNFSFLSAYVTGVWNSNLNIEVQGYRDTNLIYDETVVASATNPTLFTFNYLDIDRLYFNSFGGQPAGFGGGAGNNFVMDNMTFEFIPEPSSLLLTSLGLLSLWAVAKRRRR
ncbi:MAG: PEP-CTERM sorting domain-containing protein [Verrucomicrobiia bacterium]|jgi:hypothetical protein